MPLRPPSQSHIAPVTVHPIGWRRDDEMCKPGCRLADLACVSTYEATTALPYPHVMRASAGLRGALRRQIVDDGLLVMPDWSTFKVTFTNEAFDARGQILFQYRGSVECRSPLGLLVPAAPAPGER